MGVLDKLKLRKENKKKLTYKEEHGTTRAGDFLRGVVNVAPELLALAGSVTGLPGLHLLGKAIKDDPEMSDLNKQLAIAELEKDMTEERELTKRLQSDNEHDVTRLIRPISYGFVWLLFGVNMFFDGNIREYEIRAEYIPVIENLLRNMTYFYFGSRGLEKIVKEVMK
jgi:hypothetical protein